MTKSVKRRITNILPFVILSLGAVLILFPIAWMLSTALKSAPEIATVSYTHLTLPTILRV